MRNLSIKQFCRKYRACDDGREWALANCKNMNDAWKKLPSNYLQWVARCDGVLTDRELRLFAVFCARQNQHLLTDQRSIDAIDVAERFANGDATKEELSAAYAAARAAARAAANAANAAYAAANAANAAYAAYAAVYAAANAAANAAAYAEQDKWLRENTRPNFTGKKI